ncbi:MAG: SAM-dependent methyltransferase [Acidobacteria bacterium]|nr:SAM-dependent methyltransferase [Acidobacteriota bacterium]
MSETRLEEFINSLETSLENDAFVKLTLAKYKGVEPGLKNVYVRPVELKGEERLSFLRRYKTKDVVENHTFAEAVAIVRDLLGGEFLSGHLFTVERDSRIEINRKHEAKLSTHPPTFSERRSVEHDRKKQRLVETEGNVYLRALGVTNERGEVRPGMADKFRQINKFIETLSGLFAASPLARERGLSVVDMGSGKGYLTFAVYDYLNRQPGLEAKVTGVEARAELVGLCNGIAREAGFEQLSFETGYIQNFELPETDILIALHACDTATDDALFKGIAANASIIIAAPCCHKEVRPQIETPEPLRGVLRHGILLEREAESVTDSLRALLLESAGYMVKVFEFISTEHTRKNTMIAGVKKEGGADGELKWRQYQALKDFYGIREQRLERLLCENRFV